MWERIISALVNLFGAICIGLIMYFGARDGDPAQLGGSAALSALILMDFMRSEVSNGQEA